MVKESRRHSEGGDRVTVRSEPGRDAVTAVTVARCGEIGPERGVGSTEQGLDEPATALCLLKEVREMQTGGGA